MFMGEKGVKDNNDYPNVTAITIHKQVGLYCLTLGTSEIVYWRYPTGIWTITK